MNHQSIILTPRVIDTINSLPAEERLAIASALAGEIILRIPVKEELTSEQSMLYAIIRDYIRRDSIRHNRAS